MADWLTLRAPSCARGAARVGCYLGSFDPPHLGHIALARALLEDVDQVMFLVPATHFHKNPRFPDNATLDQRLEMLEPIRSMRPGSINIGITRVILFLELDTRLRQRFPSARIVFGMGDETYEHLLDSAFYYARAGLRWTGDQALHLRDLASRCRVWNRSGQASEALTVQPNLQGVSSTRVRALARELWQRPAKEAEWFHELRPLVPTHVVDAIRNLGLYRVREN